MYLLTSRDQARVFRAELPRLARTGSRRRNHAGVDRT